MKMIYQKPEVDIVLCAFNYSIMDKSGGALGPGGGDQPGMESNESKTFDEGEITTNNSLWED